MRLFIGDYDGGQKNHFGSSKIERETGGERIRDREKRERDRARYDEVVTTFKSQSAVVLSPLI